MNPSSFQGHIPAPGTFGEVIWSSPSNIALTKYWGKHGHQLPRNASVSFTLSEAKTITKVKFEFVQRMDDVHVDFWFEGEEKPDFADRIVQFFKRNESSFPYLKYVKWSISSKNTFPHSSGIASSASAMSCLVMAVVDIERRFMSFDMTDEEAMKRVSFLSRLASGSACRSVYPLAAEWGENPQIEDSSDLYAISFAKELHEVFRNYHDDILIVSDTEKQVSSSAGHQLMEDNPFAAVRFQQANDNTVRMMEVLRTGDLTSFVEIVESEALTLHALMMTSQPSYVLMRPDTLSVIEKVRAFREKTEIPIAFTLDAGPNVHLLYPDAHADQCRAFIQTECVDKGLGRLISDHVGFGPERLSSFE